MEFTIHPYNSEKTVEQVMLIDGSIVDWLLTARGLTGPAVRIATYIRDRLMPQIDAKPIARPCAGCGGQGAAHHPSLRIRSLKCVACAMRKDGRSPRLLGFLRSAGERSNAHSAASRQSPTGLQHRWLSAGVRT